jgi:hypothetical protein
LPKEDALGPLQLDDLALAERVCALCHSIGLICASAHNGAPAFRHLDRRIDFDGFTRQLRDGLVSGHPDMPFRFSCEDARALTPTCMPFSNSELRFFDSCQI